MKESMILEMGFTEREATSFRMSLSIPKLKRILIGVAELGVPHTKLGGVSFKEEDFSLIIEDHCVVLSGEIDKPKAMFDESTRTDK